MEPFAVVLEVNRRPCLTALRSPWLSCLRVAARRSPPPRPGPDLQARRCAIHHHPRVLRHAQGVGIGGLPQVLQDMDESWTTTTRPCSAWRASDLAQQVVLASVSTTQRSCCPDHGAPLRQRACSITVP